MIKVILDNETCNDVSVFTFNDGSVQVKIEGELPDTIKFCVIQAQVQSPETQMALVLTVDALRSMYVGISIQLMMPFCPYGRQDDVFVKGEANGMKAWAGVINSLELNAVCVLDPHSNAINLIDNIQIVKQYDIVASMSDLVYFQDVTLVSPDAGANKKAHALCKGLGITKMVRADKARDLSTGVIIETELYGEVTGETCLIVDDICDGGMTFIKLAEKLKEQGASRVILFVTHGIFSKGLSVFEGLIDEVYTTNSWIRAEDFKGDYSGKFSSIDD